MLYAEIRRVCDQIQYMTTGSSATQTGGVTGDIRVRCIDDVIDPAEWLRIRYLRALVSDMMQV